MYPSIPAFANYITADNSQSLNMECFPDNPLAQMFTRYLLQKAISVFEWTMPRPWNRNYFLYVLYCYGHLAVINTDKYGVIPQACGLAGYNVFYQPTNAIISNPLLTGIVEPRIDKECVLFKLQPDYGGILDLVFYYGNMMAQAAQSAAVSLNNSKAAMMFFAENQADADLFKKMFDKISNGQPGIVVPKRLKHTDGSPSWEVVQRTPKDSYIAGDVLRDLRKIEAMFDTDVGIPNANTEKRERLITDEVNANNIETLSKCSLWLQELREACDKTRAMFGIDVSVKWREYDVPAQIVPEGGAENGNV